MSDATPTTVQITRPDDWHVHLRDGAALAAVLPDTARQFARAIVMPNLQPPLTSTAQEAMLKTIFISACEFGWPGWPRDLSPGE